MRRQLGEETPPYGIVSELVAAHHRLANGDVRQAAAAYERLGERLLALGHARYLVLHGYAAGAWARVGELERASNLYAIYLAAGGADPPELDGFRSPMRCGPAARRGSSALGAGSKRERRGRPSLPSVREIGADEAKGPADLTQI